MITLSHFLPRRESLPAVERLYFKGLPVVAGLPKSALVKKLREFNCTPVEALQNDELLDLMLPTLRADFELCKTYEYHPESPFECLMTIYGGMEDHEVEAERLAAWR